MPHGHTPPIAAGHKDRPKFGTRQARCGTVTQGPAKWVNGRAVSSGPGLLASAAAARSRDGFHERQVGRWTTFLDRIKGRELPGFDIAAAWLRAHRPIDYIPGLMHGDYQLANVMFRKGASARLAAIVDWEMGTVGDPKLDLG